jgi:hypothetical protein
MLMFSLQGIGGHWSRVKKGVNPNGNGWKCAGGGVLLEDAAFISLFLISITSLYIERETGIEPATSSLGKWTSTENKVFSGFDEKKEC